MRKFSFQIALLVCLVCYTLIAREGGSWGVERDDTRIFQKDDLDTDKYYDFEKKYADQWSLKDKLQQNYRKRQFRNNLKKDYQSLLFDYPERITPSDANLSSWDLDLTNLYYLLAIIAKIIGYLIIIGVILLLVRAFISKSGVSINRLRVNKSAYEYIEPNESSIQENWLLKAVEAKKKGDLRLAVRYYFLAYLKQLHEENHIDYHKEKTNREYRYEIADSTVKKEFDVLSRVFDYCWYGDFEINNEQFVRVEMLFSNHLKK